MRVRKQQRKNMMIKYPPISFDDLLLLFIETREKNGESCYIKNSAIVFPDDLDSTYESYMYYLLWCVSEEKAAVIITKEFFLVDISPSILSAVEAIGAIGRELGTVELVMPGAIGGRMDGKVWRAIDRLRMEEKRKRLNVYQGGKVSNDAN